NNTERKGRIPIQPMVAFTFHSNYVVSDPCPPSPKADIDRWPGNVRFVPIADIGKVYSITSPARASTGGGTARPRAFAVLRLIASSYLVAACNGSSAGF